MIRSLGSLFAGSAHGIPDVPPGDGDAFPVVARGLYVWYGRRVEGLVRDLARSKTVILCTHNLGLARRVADRVAFFWGGRVLETGSPAEIFERPSLETTRDYVAGRIA